MSVTCGFFNSVNSDRRYNAAQMSSIFDGVITDGVFASVGECLLVSPVSGMSIAVAAGRAWFNSTWTANDTEFPLTLDASETVLNRYDAVVLEVNTSTATRANSFKMVKGTPATNPSYPTLTNTNEVHQHPLAYVYVAAKATSITASNITNCVGTETTPFVTGILETASIEALYQAWQDQFDSWLWQEKLTFEEWFDELQSILSGDVAGNLQVEIDNLKINSATAELLGVSYTSDMSPNLGFQALRRPRLIQSYSVAGAYTYKIPMGVTRIFIAMIGGGGDGSWNQQNGSSDRNVNCGASGYVYAGYLDVVPNTYYHLVVGQSAQSTSGFGFVVAGGESGEDVNGGGHTTQLGGQRSGAYYDVDSKVIFCGQGVIKAANTSSVYASGGDFASTVAINLMLQVLGGVCNMPFLMAAGSHCNPDDDPSAILLPNGNTAAVYCSFDTDSMDDLNAIISIEKGTDPGSGGGSIFVDAEDTDFDGSISGSAGVDGGIFIYDVTGGVDLVV